jgi:competence protein ComEA
LLAWLERNQFLALALAGLVLLAGLSARQLTQHQAPPALVFRDGAGVTPGAPILIHVAGAVAAPGVYTLQGGDRVEDAVSAAGGALPDADLDAINLARRLRDGEQILVPAASDSGGEVAVATLAPGEKLDLNVATAAQLDALPGIGEAYAQRVLDSRLVDGPFESVDDLRSRNVLPASIFTKVSDLLTVSQP